jgi:hypothetical protein
MASKKIGMKPTKAAAAKVAPKGQVVKGAKPVVGAKSTPGNAKGGTVPPFAKVAKKAVKGKK